MADTRLSDAVVPEVFMPYMVKDTMQKMAFMNTGVLRTDATLAANLAGGGISFQVPFWKDLDDTESGIASDDPAVSSTPGKIGSGKDIARRQIRTRSWSTMDLVDELAGSDPMQRIASRSGDYWSRQFDDVAINTARGLFADNIANDSGDMVNDVAIDTASALTADNLFSADAVIDTLQTLGDAKANVNLVLVHSVVHTTLEKNDLITFVPDSKSQRLQKTFMGLRLEMSDRLPVIAGTNKTMYHSYVFGADAMGWAEHAVATPVEVDRKPAIGNGMGGEVLYTRRQFVCHPYGIKFTESSVAGNFPTNAELRTAANWDRVYAERKQIPMGLLVTNG